MQKFNDIHNKQTVNENKVDLKNYIDALTDLKEAAGDKNHPLVTSRAIKTYYSNAIDMGNTAGFFDSKLRKKVNRINREFAKLSGESDAKLVEKNIEIILTDLKVDENSAMATISSTNGMGDVQLPGVDGEIGSGDVPGGATGEEKVFVQTPAETIAMKKFESVKENREINEKEIFIPITDLADPAILISTLAKELTKRSNAKETAVSRELANIEISYNGLVNVFTLGKLSEILDTDIDSLKKTLDKLIDKNINLLEAMQLEFWEKVLNDPESINEGILGRAIGGIAGFALGPKVGKMIAKVLGIEKGPLYNVLTSRIVSAALAQELTKNLI
jgi:hypothetical protein